ncbi:MAG TPA: Ig-like domain-containing protein [Aquabacterium sp.]|nr:Ig-like domain-containing protein [Aquabacterium sp.]
MRSADRRFRPSCFPSRLPMRPTALALPLAIALPAIAQTTGIGAPPLSAPPAGSPTDLRFTPVNGDAPLLHPRIPGRDAEPGQVLAGDTPYAANAAVARIVVEVDRDGVPADGQSPVQLQLRLFDRDGQPLKTPAFVTLETSGGRLLLPGARTDELGPRGLDADRATPGVQLKVDGGVARFTLLAPDQAQDVRVRVSAGGQEAAGVIRFVPELRPMVAAGLVEGIVNLRRGALQAVPQGGSGDVFEREIRAFSRTGDGGKASVAARGAFYLKGTVRGDLLLTAAYDSDKDTRARLLRDIRPDEVYPVYGDASLRSVDARSGSKLFVRVDKDRSDALFGDFVTGDGFSQPAGQGAVASLKQRSLGQYNRTATGVRLHHEDPRPSAAMSSPSTTACARWCRRSPARAAAPTACATTRWSRAARRSRWWCATASSRRASSASGRWRAWSTTASSRSPAASCCTSSCRRSTTSSTRSACG